MSILFDVKDIHVSYGGNEIVKGVSFSLQEGELCALLGLNGSGKTTMMRGICGLIPAKGNAYVNGIALESMNERMRAKYLSFIPQVSSPIQEKSVMDILLMGANPHLRLLETPGKKFYEAAYDALKKLNLEDFADRDFGKLSQGQKQLIILARTLVQNSPVMLMDEPDSALDFLNRHMVLSKIREVVKEEKKAGLLTLHDPNFAMAYCDRLLLLKSGKLVAEVDMRKASEEEIKDKLSVLYGKIALLSYENGYLMGKSVE